MKSAVFSAFALFAPVALAVPSVSSVSLVPSDGGSRATVLYSLSGGPAIVTLDILTNNASIGGAHVQRVSGDVNVVVSNTSCSIVWECAYDWPDGSAGLDVQAKVTAWPTNNPPDWLVVDLSKYSVNRTRWYEDPDFVPGGVQDGQYKTTKMVMRRIPARGVKWTMGSPEGETGRSSNETQHDVTMSNDYYIAIYKMTCMQSQMGCNAFGQMPSPLVKESTQRPVMKMQYTALRGADSYHTPDVPVANSYLDKLRTLTGLDMDIPSESQWEFACRAGHYGSTWNDGSAILSSTNDKNLNNLARYKYTGGTMAADTPAKDGYFANVGSYKPNSWGLYDMHGNGCEWCRDAYQADITGLGGAVCTNESYSSGAILRVLRAGNVGSDANALRSARRGNDRSNNWYGGVAAYRPVCQAGIPIGMEEAVVPAASDVSSAVALAVGAATSVSQPSASVINLEWASTLTAERTISMAPAGLAVILH